MSSKSKSSNGGIGFTGLLTIVFITLKLTGTIDWSWWWVLSPIWIAATIAVVLFIALVAIRLREPPVARATRELSERLGRRP